MSATSAQQHCPTCDCFDPSSLGILNIRIAAHMRRLLGDLPISDAVKSRLPASTRYQLGFTGMKFSADTTVIMGQFLVGIRTDEYEPIRGRGKDNPDAGPDPTRPNHQPRYRFAMVMTLSPRYIFSGDGAVPVVVEYRPGDQFERPYPPKSFAHEELFDWSSLVGDDELRNYLSAHLKPLIEWAEKTVAEINAGATATAV